MFKKVLQVMIGYWILTLGISLIIVSDVGAGAWDTVYVGLEKQFGLTIGLWSFLTTTSLIFINALLAWEKPKLSSFIGSVLAGLGIDFWMELIFQSTVLYSITIKVIIFILGVMFLSLGIAVYIRAKFFSGAIDGLMLATSKRLKISIKYARLINEIMALILGFVLGGPVGLGTLIVAIGLGYGIEYNTRLLDYLKSKGLQIT